MTDPLELLRDALLNPSDNALRHVRDNAAAIRLSLDGDGAETLLSADEFDRLSHDGRLGQVYAALGGEREGGEPANSLVQAMLAQQSDEQAEIGEAFALLLYSLDLRFHEWERWFRDAPQVSASVAGAIRAAAQRSIDKGGEHAGALMRWGITPLAVQEATIALEYLFDRTRRALQHQQEGRRVPDWVSASELGVRVEVGPGMDDFAVPNRILDAQIAGVSNLPSGAAGPLRGWLLNVLAERPHLVPGHVFDARANRFAREIVAPEQADLPDDLVLRWCRPAALQPVSLPSQPMAGSHG